MNKVTHKVSVLGIISKAANLLESNKIFYFKVLLLPALLMVFLFLLYYTVYKIFPDIPQWVGWVFSFMIWASYAVFAVVCHRLVLLQSDKALKPYVISITRREMIFSMNLIIIAVVVFMLAWMVSIPLITLYNALSLSYLGVFIFSGFGLLQMYFLGRFCLVLPSIAIDERITLKQSWVVTRGNSFRIFGIIGIVPLFLFLLSSMSGDSAEHTGVGYIIDILFVFLQPVVLAFEVFLVSLIYKDLKEHWGASKTKN